MSSDDLVVRYTARGREQVDRAALAAARQQMVASVWLLAAMTVLVVLGILGASTHGWTPRSLVLGVVLVPFAVLAAAAVRRVRRPFRLGETAFSVTDEEIRCEAIASLGVLNRRKPAAVFERRTTSVRLSPARPPIPERLVLTPASGRWHRRAYRTDLLDVPADRIVAAIERP